MSIIGEVEVVHEQGVGAENEDAWLALPERGWFAVLDGATALGRGGLTGKLASDAIRAALLAADPDRPLLDVVVEANRRLGEAVVQRAGPGAATIDAIPKDERSSCGLVLARLGRGGRGGGTRLDFVQAGDCMLFARYADGDVRALTHDPIAHLDRTAIDGARAVLGELVGGRDPATLPAPEIARNLAAARERVSPLLRANRRLLNTAAGYGVLDGSPEAVEFLDWGSVNAGRIRALLLLSDGLQLPDGDDTATEAWLRTARFAFAHGLRALHDRVAQLESEDPSCMRYPRIKAADDKTGLLIRLEHPAP